MKHIFTALFLLLCAMSLFGCTQKAAATIDTCSSSPVCSVSVTSNETSESSSLASSSPYSTSKLSTSTARTSSLPSKQRAQSSSQRSASSSSNPSHSSSIIPSNAIYYERHSYDTDLARKCMYYGYDYKIMRGIVEGTLDETQLSKLNAEVKYYGGIFDTGITAKYFKADSPNVIGDKTAIQKAKKYMKAIYDYNVPTNAHCYIQRYSSGQSYFDRQNQSPTYTVGFSNSDSAQQAKNIECSVFINALNGQCQGADYMNRAIQYKIPKSNVIHEMQSRALKFVTDKKLMANSKCVYMFTDTSTFADPDTTGDLPTTLYFANGYRISIDESYRQGNMLNFSISLSHGFQNQ